MFRRGVLLGLSAVLVVPAGAGRGVVAQEVIDREYDIKAAYLYHFTRYVEWPKNAVPGDDGHLVIGVLGPDPFGRSLAPLAGRKVSGKTIVIRRFASARDYKPCHILFVAAGANADTEEKTVAARVKAVLARTRGSPVLLVSDTDELAEKGTMINFYIEENKLKLAINRDAALRARLKISAQLLGLRGVVKIVTGGASSRPQGPGHHARIS